MTRYIDPATNCQLLLVSFWALVSTGTVLAQEQNYDELPKYRSGDQVMYATVLSNLVYPTDCRERNQKGTAYVSVRINRVGQIDGMVLGQQGPLLGTVIFSQSALTYPTEVPITEQSDMLFDIALSDALQKLGEFYPATKDDEPIGMWVTFAVSFELMRTRKVARDIYRLEKN